MGKKRIESIIDILVIYVLLVFAFYAGNQKPFFQPDGRLMPLWLSAYWRIAAGTGVLLFLYGLCLIRLLKQGKSNFVLHLFDLWENYREVWEGCGLDDAGLLLVNMEMNQE